MSFASCGTGGDGVSLHPPMADMLDGSYTEAVRKSRRAHPED